MRTITALCLTAAVFVIIFLQGQVYNAVFTAVLLLSLYEVMTTLEKNGRRPMRPVVYLYGIAQGIVQGILVAMGSSIPISLACAFSVLVIFSMIAFAAVVFKDHLELDRVRDTLLPMLYPGAFFAFLFPLNFIHGKMMTVAAMLLTFFVSSMNDSFALLFGVRFGKHKFSPAVSPKKTVEGAVAGLVASVAFGVAIPYGVYGITWAVPFFRPFLQAVQPWWQYALVGLIAGAAGQIGDLAASLVKRQCGVKDFGDIFPGHGGVMDRVDGILFSAVIFLIFFIVTGA